MNGYTGAVLHVDLSQGTTHVDHPEEAFYRRYGGGSGMGLFYILEGTPKGVDPLGAENILTLFTGPVTGMAISGQSRISANAVSPLSGAIGDSQAGGYFPAWLKFAGYDGIVIRGQAQAPVFLYINAGNAELLDASEIWGKDTEEVDQVLAERFGKVEVMQIGPAGEKLVRIAAIMNMHTRAAGRTGMGAVMGSKLLKAIVVQGKQRVRAAQGKTITRQNREGTANIENIPDMKGLGINGTSDGVPFQQTYGTLPAYNYNEGTFDQFMEVSGERMSDTILVERDTCFACTVRCKRVVETEFRNKKVRPTYGGPEYETIATLGTYCGVADLDAIALGNQLCNQYGMDTIGCGAAISFAMECFERGVINLEDTGGIDLRFGNAEAMVEMVEQIAERRGFGNVLAEGSERAANLIGRGADEFLITVKGTEVPAHMPQAKKTLGLIYAVNPFGADHQSHEHDPFYEEGVGDFYLKRLALLGLTSPQPVYSLTEEKIRFAYLTELFYSAVDSYSLCQFVYGPAWQLYGPAEMAEILCAATGWEVSVDEIMKVGERRLNMMRAFNAREGLSRKNDQLPKKFLKPLQGKGATSGVALKTEDLEWAKDVYFGLAGWDGTNGNPGIKKLNELELGWFELQEG